MHACTETSSPTSQTRRAWPTHGSTHFDLNDPSLGDPAFSNQASPGPLKSTLNIVWHYLYVESTER